MVGVLLLLVYGAVALVWRSVVHQRRSGDLRSRLADTTPLGKAAALVMVVGHAVVLLGSIGAGWQLGAVAVGTVVFLAGLALVVRAQVAMGDSWRVGVDPNETTALVTDGPFAVVRNPIFTGMVVGLAGIAVAAWSGVAAIGVVTVWLGIELQVRLVEEPYLLRTHGRAFAAYREQAGRFVPRRATISPWGS